MIRRALPAAGLLLPLASRAAEQGRLFASPEANEVASAGGVASVGQVTLSLAIVLAVVFLAAWAMKRLRGFNRRGGHAIDVVADIALGTKERAVLLRVGSTHLLVGVAPGRVNTLHVLSADESAAASVAVPTDPGLQGANPSAPSFRSLLRRSLGLS